MVVLLFYSLFFSFWCFIRMYAKKVILLMSLEVFMLSIIISYLYDGLVSNLSFFVVLILCLMMVVDSVFGLSSLIFFSRHGHNSSQVFFC